MTQTTTFLVPCNKLQKSINHSMIYINSKTSKQECYTIVATNMSKKVQYVMISNTLYDKQCPQVKFNAWHLSLKSIKE